MNLFIIPLMLTFIVGVLLSLDPPESADDKIGRAFWTTLLGGLAGVSWVAVTLWTVLAL